MATEILINDGGAPARILPFVASEDLTAGYAIAINSSGEAKLSDRDDGELAAIGYALTTITSGNIASVISGHGVILNAYCAAITAGKGLMLGTTDGQLVEATNVTLLPNNQATALETGTGGLTKVITH